MAGESAEQLIINRLAQAPSFHPSGAKLFVPDWTLDPGDVVTVQSDGENYNVPIYSMDLTWNGACRADIQSTGNQQREPLSALRRKEYQTGRRGYGLAKQVEEEVDEQYQHWTTENNVYKESVYKIMGVELNEDGTVKYIQATDEQGNPIYDEQGNPVWELDEAGNPKPVYNPDSDGSISGTVRTTAQDLQSLYTVTGVASLPSGESTLYSYTSKIKQKADAVSSEVTAARGGETSLSSKITQLSGQIGLVVEKKNNKDVINRAAIVAAINEDDKATVTISADQIDLQGYVTANELFVEDALTAENTIYANDLVLNEGISCESADAESNFGVVNATSLTTETVYAGELYVGKDDTDIMDLFMTSGIVSASVANNILTLTDSDGNEVNFSKATALNTGKVDADGEKKQAGWSGGVFTVIATQTNKNTTTNKYETNEVGRTTTQLTIPVGHWGNPAQDENPNTYYQGISAVIGASLSAVDTGTSVQVDASPRYYAGKNSVGLTPMSYNEIQGDNIPSSRTIFNDTTGRTDTSGNEANLHRDITLSLDVDDDYVYMKNGSTVLARMDNPGSGTAYNTGYADGQTNVNALIETITHPLGDTSYIANYLNIDITATPELELESNDTPPIITYITSRNSPNRVSPMDETIQIPVVVTDATLSEGNYTNGQYTITGSGGNVNIDAVNGQGGANIPVGVNPLTLTPTAALNSVNVVKGSWTGTTTKTIQFTTDAPSPNANAPKSVTLSWNNGSWVWASSEDSGNYQKQIQVKDGNTGVLTEYVDLPDTKVVVTSPGQQQASWWKTTGTNAYKYVVPASTAADYLSSDSSNQHVLANGTGTQTIIDPSEAILYGKSQVSVTRTWDEYTGSTTGATTLESGKTYQLQVKKDGTNVVDELYSVPAQASPTVNTWGLTHQTGTNYTYKASVKVNGTSYESENLNATEAYNNGWTGAYQSVGIFPTTVADLVPGGSPITIYAQAKATSGSSKSNVASVQVKARALNLKDETFTANDTYTVPSGYDGYGTVTVDVSGGGGGDYYATFLDNITLESTDIGDSVTKHSIANYSDGHRDSAANTRVVIDASKVYSAGVTAGLGGVVDVVKSNWNLGYCTFTPSAGSGQSQEVLLNYAPVKPGFSSANGDATINILDDNTSVNLPIKLILARRKFGLYNYACLFKNGDTLTQGNVLAKFSIDGSAVISDVASILKNGRITYQDADKKIANIPVTAYDDEDNALLSTTITADMSDTWDAGYETGYTQGSGITILDEYSTTISSNNTTVTLLPSDKGNYNVMSSAKVKIQVPVNEGIQGATLLASTDSDSAWSGWQLNDYTTLSKKYGFIRITGKDGSTYSYGVDANGVYDAGVSAGAGVQIETSKSYGSTVTETGTYTITPSSGYAAMKKATFSVSVPTIPRLQTTLAYGTASIGSHTIYPDEDYDAMKKVTFTVPNVTVETQRNQPTTGVTTTNIKVGNNIKVIVKFGNATVHQQIFAATT